MPSSIIINIDCLYPGAVALHRRALLAAGGDAAQTRVLFNEGLAGELKLAGGAEKRRREWTGRFPMALIAPIPLKLAGDCVKAAGWRNAFGVLIAVEHLSATWPDPVFFTEAARRLRAAPEECLVLEGSREGGEAARAAGFRVCGAAPGLDAEDLADPAIDA